MDLTGIIQYQKIDMELYKKEKEYGQSKELELLYRYKKLFDEKKSVLTQLSKDLENAFAQINTLNTKVEKLNPGQLESKFDPNETTDLADLAQMEQEFAKIEEEINAVYKDMGRLFKKINDINYDNKKINDELQSLNAEAIKLNSKLKAKQEEMLKETKPILIKLKALSANVDEKILARYKELRKAKKMPAFVVYNEGSCGGCGMDIAIEVGKKLINSGDIVECPHCGRMVYKK